tara:strand:+ start:620 stop:2494 length:1875 start_codon:yes stop_codon:yes gene_type:complete
MAYKSPITNKYMGSTFAGRVNPGRENELTQLARSLDQFSDALPRGVAAYKGNKIDEAEERLEELRTTMSPEELNDYILKGEDSILSNKWAVSVVDGQLGRFDAAKAIRTIVENSANYDYTTGNRREFYKEFLPDFGSKSSSYKNGFGVHFNEWQSRDLLQDATKKAEFRQESKIQRGVEFASTIQYENLDEWYDVVKSLNSRLPNTDGKENYFFSNQDINEVIIRLAEFTATNATSQEDFDLALSYLNYDRGVADDGTKLGALGDTARKDVQALKEKIKNEKFKFVSQDYRYQQFKEEEFLRDNIANALADIGTENEYATFKKYRDAIEDELGTPAAQELDKFYLMERNEVDPNVVQNFNDAIIDGQYNGDVQGMIEDMRLLGIPPAYVQEFTQSLKQAEDVEIKGTGWIFNNNETYTTNKSLILQEMQGLFVQKGVGINSASVRDTAGYNAASSAAIQYMNRQILNFENQVRDGRLTELDRLNFMERLGAQVMRMFKPIQTMEGPKEYRRPGELQISQEPDFAEVSTELLDNRATLGNIVEGITANPVVPDGIIVDPETQTFQTTLSTQEIATNIVNQLPAYLNNNLATFVKALTPNDVKRLEQAYGLSSEQVMDVLRLISEN